MKAKMLLAMLIISMGCTKVAQRNRHVKIEDSLRSRIFELEIEVQRYQIILDRVQEKDSVLFQEVMVDLE